MNDEKRYWWLLLYRNRWMASVRPLTIKEIQKDIDETHYSVDLLEDFEFAESGCFALVARKFKDREHMLSEYKRITATDDDV